MTDSHAHLSFSEIQTALSQVLDEFKRKQGNYILNVGYDPESNIEVLNTHSRLSPEDKTIVYNAIGIHPEYLSQLLSKDLDMYKQLRKLVETFKELLKDNLENIKGIGECGLDYYHLRNDKGLDLQTQREYMDVQKNMFREHVALAHELQIPLSVHTRDIEGEDLCIEDTLQIVVEAGKGNVKGVFHSYTQNSKYLSEILGLGFYVGFNGIITYPKADNVRDILKKVPLNRIVLETDTPLLPSYKVRKDRKYWRHFGAPADVEEIAQKAAEVKDVAYDEIIKQTTDNFKNLFLID
ncbi:MAG: Hydrolase, TatD family [candidate division WS6 bacterium GW2011_GWF2_39_15]|uniref:Hydrolase, TatD family n=1 Tax=candidate division WS6 bacterium GW2011_GWF2_39_15 TaxID=1619100 RepID=A0A0G0MQ70_9BACT|nr:MAG: Hydrolase, TatD family [candidate division WS6 bacterium GW2011_GWF2_39_15]